jgi:hypothetical protein
MLRSILVLSFFLQLAAIEKVRANNKFDNAIIEFEANDEDVKALIPEIEKLMRNNGCPADNQIKETDQTMLRLLYDAKLNYMILNKHCPKQIIWSTTGQYSENKEEFRNQIKSIRSMRGNTYALRRIHCEEFDSPNHPLHKQHERTHKKYADMVSKLTGEVLWEQLEIEMRTKGVSIYPMEFWGLPGSSGQKLHVLCDTLLNNDVMKYRPTVDYIEKLLNPEKQKEKQNAERF